MADCTYSRNGLRLVSRRQGGAPQARLPGLAAGVFLCLATNSFAASDATTVTDVRYWSLDDVTRVAIEADADFAFKATRLTNPDRLFFDISDAKPDSPRTKTITVDDGLVKRIRVAETQKGITRIVLDLEHEAEYKTSLLRGPARLVVEVRPKGGSAKPVIDRPHDEKSKEDKPRVEPKPEPVEIAKAFTGPKSAAHAAPRQFVPPPMELLPPSPVKPHKFPPIEYVAPPPAFSLFAKPSKLPKAGVLPTLPRPVEPAVPARRIGDGAQTLTRVLGLKLGKIILDPGHGGHDDGTHGPSGMKEKELVLDVSLRLAALLEQRLGSEVVLTRSDDTFIPLEERTRFANEKRADLFLSIHANSSPVRSVSGIETYYLSLNGAKTALETAARENADSQHSIFELKELLNKIALKDKLDESREFAAAIQGSLFSLVQKNSRSSHDRGTKRAPFIVLIGADMPSVLAEIGFLTNSLEESLLRRDEYRDKVAEALYRGIANYAETLSRTVVARTK